MLLSRRHPSQRTGFAEIVVNSYTVYVRSKKNHAELVLDVCFKRDWY